MTQLTQVMPCNKKIYAIFRDRNGEDIHIPVLGFGLNNEGYLVPLIFDRYNGIDTEDGASNFVTFSMNEGY